MVSGRSLPARMAFSLAVTTSWKSHQHWKLSCTTLTQHLGSLDATSHQIDLTTTLRQQRAMAMEKVTRPWQIWAEQARPCAWLRSAVPFCFWLHDLRLNSEKPSVKLLIYIHQDLRQMPAQNPACWGPPVLGTSWPLALSRWPQYQPAHWRTELKHDLSWSSTTSLGRVSKLRSSSWWLSTAVFWRNRPSIHLQ